MNKLILYMILIVVFISSCSDSFITDLSRSDEDPFIESPIVESFTGEYLIKVTWSEDECADGYILHRSLDNADDYEIVYQGNSTGFEDTNVINEYRYLYKLTKYRGDHSFGPSVTQMGIGSGAVQDEFEPNDSESEATEFHYNVSANTYYYVSEGIKHKIVDEDWYSIEVRPRMKALFKVSVSSVSADAPTGLLFFQNPKTPESIINMNDIYIENTSYEKKVFYFSIYPDGASIITNTHGGGRIIPYELNFVGENQL